MKLLFFSAIASLMSPAPTMATFDVLPSTVTSDGPTVCPNDFQKIHQVGNAQATAPPIEVLEQNGGTVKFKVSQIWTPQEAEKIIVQYAKGSMGESKCETYEGVGDGDDLTFTATCAMLNPITVVDIFVVDQSVEGDAKIPECCHTSTSLDTVKYTYGIMCSPTCPGPEGEPDPECPEVILDFNDLPEYSYVYDDYWNKYGVKIIGESKSSDPNLGFTPLPKKQFPIGSAWEDRYGFEEHNPNKYTDDVWDESLHSQAGGAVRVFNTNKPNAAGGNTKCNPEDDDDGDFDLGSPNNQCPSSTPGKKSSGPGRGKGGESGAGRNCPSELLGNVLVIQEGTKSCPDDTGAGGWITFDFNEAIAGDVQFTYAKLLDTDEKDTPEIRVWKDDEDVTKNPKTRVYTTPETGNNGLWYKSFEQDGTWNNRYTNLQRIQFEYFGSGSIAEIRFKPSKCPPKPSGGSSSSNSGSGSSSSNGSGSSSDDGNGSGSNSNGSNSNGSNSNGSNSNGSNSNGSNSNGSNSNGSGSNSNGSGSNSNSNSNGSNSNGSGSNSNSGGSGSSSDDGNGSGSNSNGSNSNGSGSNSNGSNSNGSGSNSNSGGNGSSSDDGNGSGSNSNGSNSNSNSNSNGSNSNSGGSGSSSDDGNGSGSGSNSNSNGSGSNGSGSNSNSGGSGSSSDDGNGSGSNSNGSNSNGSNSNGSNSNGSGSNSNSNSNSNGSNSNGSGSNSSD